MDRSINWTKLSLAITATLLLGSTVEAQCDSGSCDTAASYSVGGVASGYGGCNSGCSFGYPGSNCCGSAGCGNGFGNGHHSGWREHARHVWEIHKRDFARNQAWPKPFDCADRQLYHSIWNTMVDSGLRWNCMFTANHFDPDTNELNDVGRAKVKAIFRNAALANKYALVQNEGNQSVVESRLQNLQSAIDNWYGSDSFVEIAISDTYPGRFSGDRAETINLQSIEQTPPPFIPVATGTGSTSDVGQ